MKKLIVYLFVCFIFSCSTNDDSSQGFYYEILPVESAILPEEFTLGDVYEITLTYIKPSTCYAFNNIYNTEDANEHKIAIVTYVSLVDNNCETLDEEVETSFSFKAENSGTYIFKFWQGDDNYMVVEVPVVD
ncbi:hypothetical protein [Xanthomarina sp. GH4-25]|uniref:hypothetical protein n=1 Tax=Xanthomarina sp. GH4-25 TaxID=3349335 RepID=UPI000D680E34|nr:hypothetical protein DI383_09025 [Flavobacteriaceae bacterium LYZ1037]